MNHLFYLGLQSVINWRILEDEEKHLREKSSGGVWPRHDKGFNLVAEVFGTVHVRVILLLANEKERVNYGFWGSLLLDRFINVILLNFLDNFVKKSINIGLHRVVPPIFFFETEFNKEISK